MSPLLSFAVGNLLGDAVVRTFGSVFLFFFCCIFTFRIITICLKCYLIRFLFCD